MEHKVRHLTVDVGDVSSNPHRVMLINMFFYYLK